MEPLVETTRSGAVATLLLNSPANRNALSSAMVGQLGSALEAALADATVRVVVISHSGSAFCAGADLKEQTAAGPNSRAPGVGALIPLFTAIMDAPKPVVCRVDGAARAGGVGLVAACDLVVASDRASFATGEVRIGLAPAVLSVVAVPRIGLSAASWLFLTGQVVNAAEAHRIGLVHRITTAEGLEPELQQLLQQLLLASPQALAATKRLLQELPGMERDAAFSQMSRLSADLFSSSEAQEGMRAFLERRHPDWVS